ncbi:TetR/AcrR family transcriptional regulator [Pseudonocardia sp. TRM90224]|uniref:TetR/AcrR family transcriptional regulator n=1 Tax=Pseudonocardia sp. TRM90224 TaxID=2812678 RepID=UPI001E5BDE42|nr:TetR/AcrR family transcriptional regulator [Pseudonocardia sp. TRM90224]
MTAVDRLLASGPTPRADAHRNVERLVAAAREAVAEIGTGVTAHEIAQRAGVGIGTFYRRLSSRDDLLAAILLESIEEGLRLAAEALDEPDPWAGFTGFATAFVQLRAVSCGVNNALAGRATVELPLDQVRDGIRKLVERAQRHGALRADVTWEDVAFLLAGTTVDHTIGLSPAATPDNEQWRRSVRVVLDGLAARPGPTGG